MQVVLQIIITVLLFGVLILIHELGHFLTAKWARVKINEFSLGMGPAIYKKQGKETLYSIRAFPIGGFVQMDGEDGNGIDENSFNNKPKWKRFIILFAGAFNNIIFGFILTCLVYGLVSQMDLIPTTIVAQFSESATSDDSGLKVGDEIISVNGYRTYTYTDLSFALSNDVSKPLDVKVRRDEGEVTLQNVVLPIVESEYGDYYDLDFKLLGVKKTFWRTISYSFNSTVSFSRSIYSFFGSLITGQADFNKVSGPIGTSKIIGDTVTTDSGIDFASLFLMMAMISINLGVVNLLPFPALDGGRIILLLFEAIFRRKLPEKAEMLINAIGFAALMVLMIAISLKDTINLF